MNPNPQEKAFSITKAEDPQAKIIIGARRAVLRDPVLKRIQGAKAMFCLLLDLALDIFVNRGRRGEITISTTKLCEELGASARTIWGWKKILVSQRHIWITKHPMPNTHPMDCFHITALQPSREPRLDVTTDGMWGNGYRRPASDMPKGARGGVGANKQHLGGGLVDRFGKPISSLLLENNAATRNFRHLPPAKSAGATCNNCYGDPQSLREPYAKNTPCVPQLLRGAPVKSAGGQSPKPALLRESQTIDQPHSNKGEPPAPPDGAFEEWIKSLAGRFPSHLEKMRDRFCTQRKQASESGRALLDRKLAKLDELLDGPQPERARPAPSPVKVITPKPVEMPLEKLKALWDKAKAEARP